MAEEALSVDARLDGVYLTVADEGTTLPGVERFLRAKGVRKYNAKAVEEMVRQKIRTPQKIAERSEAEEKSAFVAVQIEKDGLTASVQVDPPFFTKPWPDAPEIYKLLEQRGIVFGVDKEATENLTNMKLGGEPVVVARGQPAKNGVHARIELLVDPDSIPKQIQEQEQDAQKVDHRSRSAFVNVRKGDTIAVKHPATEGENGMSVIGAVLEPVPGKDTSFPSGSGLEISEDGLTLSAAIDGRLLRKDGKLLVLPELEVPGDVDFSVGNIDFTGSVKIRGGVREGFSVIAAGDIEIKEVVEGAYIKSAGNIVILGGVRGMSKGQITADGSIQLGFVDQAHIRSRGDIRVKNAILHSDVSAQNSVSVLGGQRSQIAGGKIQAGVEVVCQTLGSEMGTKTEVIVGVPPEQVERRKELQSLLTQRSEEFEKIELNLGFLKKLEQVGKLDEEKRLMSVKLTQAKFKTQAAVTSMTKELAELEERLAHGKSKGIVRVKDICYPGVSIMIRGASYAVREPFKFSAFVYEGGEVRLRSFDA
ncbi:MAG: FapA family protein [Synergistaceae bacterium]|nr:FapA family protein [Synergistaceae bacterium]